VQRLALARPLVTEVTVEDPAPGFVKLRDATDFELCARLRAFEGPSSSSSSSAESLAALPAAEVARLQALTKLTAGQLQRCADATALQRLLQPPQTAETSKQQQLMALAKGPPADAFKVLFETKHEAAGENNSQLSLIFVFSHRSAAISSSLSFLTLSLFSRTNGGISAASSSLLVFLRILMLVVSAAVR
jgi:hypothetical protein